MERYKVSALILEAVQCSQCWHAMHLRGPKCHEITKLLRPVCFFLANMPQNSFWPGLRTPLGELTFPDRLVPSQFPFPSACGGASNNWQ